MTLIINAQIHTMEPGCPAIEPGYLLIQDNKIQSLGSMTHMPNLQDASVIDAAGAILTPGLIDAHSHIGMWEDSLNFEGADGNEETDPITPHLRALDAINPMDAAFGEAVCAGVTTVVVGPGSANPIGGQLLAMKTLGRCVDTMLITQPLAIKAAFGENPKSVYNDKNQTPSTRMATAALIRESLSKAKEYMEQLDAYHDDPENETKPDWDAKCEALLPLLRRHIPLHAHAHRADDIFTALRIAKEFHLRLVLVHATEGHLVIPELKQAGVPILSGPILTDRSKPELRHQSEAAPALLTQADIPTAIITDHPETPEKHLALCAALAMRSGVMSREQAMASITRIPAEICGLSLRVGTLAPGKDADLILWEGEPPDLSARPALVWCCGKAVAASS